MARTGVTCVHRSVKLGTIEMAGRLHCLRVLTMSKSSSAPAGAGCEMVVVSTGCTTLRAASFHPWLQAGGPFGGEEWGVKSVPDGGEGSPLKRAGGEFDLELGFWRAVDHR